MTAVKVFAPAKINLTLHVTGRRADGFHLLDSLVVFADVGDWISVSRSDALRLQVVGPMAKGIPVNEDNLVLRAAYLAGVSGADITLEKHLPMASGIGGGSSDAAATLRALQRSHGAAIPNDVLSLGADVPVCMLARTARMLGIGNVVEVVDTVPSLPAVLVNPGVGIQTPDVFQLLERRDGAVMPDIPAFDDLKSCVDWLRVQRNDLQPPATALAPEINDVLSTLDRRGAMLARMSGSGATCFGIFESAGVAEAAARNLRAAHPDWWIESTVLADQVRRATT